MGVNCKTQVLVLSVLFLDIFDAQKTLRNSLIQCHFDYVLLVV